MKAKDRARLAVIRTELEGYKLKIEDLGSELRDLADREQESYDNLPDSLQGADRGGEMQEAASALDDAATAAEVGGAGEAWEALERLTLE
jgi:hypothetical protein